MKTIVYIEDGSIEVTVRADQLVAGGRARYATPVEVESYERSFARDDARIASLEQRDPNGEPFYNGIKDGDDPELDAVADADSKKFAPR